MAATLVSPDPRARTSRIGPDAAAVTLRTGRVTSASLVRGRDGATYHPGLLFLGEGALLEHAVRELRDRSDILTMNGTGRDHPRLAGLAVHLGTLLDLPTLGVTHRPLCADGAWPDDEAEEDSILRIDAEVVGYWLKTMRGARPLAVHAGWRTTPATAVEVATTVSGQNRTPQPLPLARQMARQARAEKQSGRDVTSGRRSGRILWFRTAAQQPRRVECG